MVMVDLGIPPGFELLTEDFDDYRNKSAGRKSGRLEKFHLTATQAILYFNSIGAGETIALRYRLRAKYHHNAQIQPPVRMLLVRSLSILVPVNGAGSPIIVLA